MASSSGSGNPRGGPGSLSNSGDTSLWLHNKLGTSNDSWTGGSIVSQLSPETFLKIHQCFQDLQPQVKLKLLLSLFHIPKRNLEAWKFELGKILDVGKEDSEPWVCMLAEIMQTYPTTGQLNSDISVPESNKRIFLDLLTDIRKALKKTCENSDSVLPLECHYLNKNAFISVVGHQPVTHRHFTLKRKPKAAALRAELLNKSADAANKVKSLSSGGFPIRKSTMPRKMESSASLKSLGGGRAGGFRGSSRLGGPSSLSTPPSSRMKKEGGVKLLDINEQPMGHSLSKKRKRLSEIEEAGNTKAPPPTLPPIGGGGSSSNPQAPNQQTSPKEPPKPLLPNSSPSLGPPSPSSGTTPPISAISSTISSSPSLARTILPTTVPPPEYAASLPPPTQAVVTTPSGVLPPAPQPSSSLTPPAATLVSPSVSGSTIGPPSYAPPPVYAPLKATGSLTIVSSSPSQSLSQQPRTLLTLPGTSRLVQLPTHPLPQSRIVIPSAPQNILGSLQSNSLAAATQQQQIGGSPAQQMVVPSNQPPRLLTPVTVRPVLQPHIVTNATPTTQKSVLIPTSAAASSAQPARRSLTLTKEQMHEAQEMFRTANKVTRPEKALILGFMAGSRDNPCPHLGNLVTIKLSEDEESVPQKDGSSLSTVIETHFQMNYSTGQWKCIKKYRRLED